MGGKHTGANLVSMSIWLVKLMLSEETGKQWTGQGRERSYWRMWFQSSGRVGSSAAKSNHRPVPLRTRKGAFWNSLVIIQQSWTTAHFFSLSSITNWLAFPHLLVLYRTETGRLEARGYTNGVFLFFRITDNYMCIIMI